LGGWNAVFGSARAKLVGGLAFLAAFAYRKPLKELVQFSVAQLLDGMSL
jgi:hypothetical protein